MFYLDDRKCVLEFSYQRNPTAMLPQVHAGIYKHRTFTARRAVLLLKSGDEADRADSAGLVRVGQEESSVRTVVPAPSPLRLKCALEVQSAGVRAGAGAGAGAGVRSGESCPTASAPIPKAVAVLGKVYSVSYKLAVHIAATSSGNRFVDHAGAVVNVHIVADAGSSPSSASSVVVPALASLAVSLCETEGWMVCGRSRRVLFCSPFTRASAKTDADADAGAPDNTKHAMAFQLQWELVPVRLGVAPLPPVRVEYEWEQSSPAGVSAGVGMRESQLVYPSPLKANDSALVIPAATTATAGGTLEKLAVMLSPSEQTTPYVPVLQRLLSSSEKIVEFHCSLVSV